MIKRPWTMLSEDKGIASQMDEQGRVEAQQNPQLVIDRCYLTATPRGRD